MERQQHPSPAWFEPTDGQIVRSIRDARRAASGARPHGHVIGSAIGEPPPRPRDPDRPVGRIAPYWM